MRYLILLALIPNLLYAQVQYVEKDAKVPYSGFLFTPEAEAKNRKSLLDLDIYKSIDESNRRMIEYYKTENRILTEQYTLWKDNSQSLAKQVVSQKNDSFWKSTLYFVLGAAITGAIAVGINKASR